MRRTGGGAATRHLSWYSDMIDRTTLGTVVEMEPPTPPHMAVRQFVRVLFDDSPLQALMDIDSLEVVS